MNHIELAHQALDRMKRACDRGTGCHLTADMIQALDLTFIGQAWAEEREQDPTSPLHKRSKQRKELDNG